MGDFVIEAFNAIVNDYEARVAGACDDTFAYMLRAGPTIANESLLLDNACGPGFLPDALQRHLSSSSTKDVKVKVICTDAASGMIEHTKRKVDNAHSQNFWPNIESVDTHVAYSENLIDEKVITANTITYAYTNSSIDFVKDPVKVCNNIYQGLAPGGIAFFSVKAEEDRVPLIRLTEKELNPGNENFNSHYNDKFEDTGYLKQLLVDGGFSPEKVNVVQDDCFVKAGNLKELSLLVADTFSMLFRPNGWSSDEEKDKWTEVLSEHIVKHPHFVDRGEKGVAWMITMHVVSGT